VTIEIRGTGALSRQAVHGPDRSARETLGLCQTVACALVRDMINKMKTSNDPNYCVRVTADDGERGEQWLRDVPDTEEDHPTDLTTFAEDFDRVDARQTSAT